MRWIDRLQLAMKAFRLGPAVVEPADKYWGKDPEPFSPPVYGDYIATSSSVYACSNLRARNLASLPLRAYRMENGAKVEVTDGSFIDLMSRVNPHWTYQRLMQMHELSLCLWGSSFWILERGPNGTGVPTEIWWARPDRMRLIPDERNYIAGWIYEWDNERLYFKPDEVMWSRYPNPIDEFSGLSPIAATRLAIDTAHGALKSNHGIFKNGLQMAGVVTPNDNDTVWSSEQVKQLGDALERRFKGADKAHRVAVLGQSASFKTIGVSPKDAQFIELMKWSRSDVASVFAVPPELIGDHEHATYSNIEQAYKSFWTDCLIPEAALLASDITEQLCVHFPGVEWVEFDTTHISALQPDKASLVEQATKWVAMGVPLNKVLSEIAPSMLPEDGGYPWGEQQPGSEANVFKYHMDYGVLTLNEIRERLGLPPIQGGDTPPKPMMIESPDNTQPATRAIKGEIGMTRPAKMMEFGSPEHVGYWKAWDARARRLEARMQATVEDLMRQQAEELTRLVAEQAEKMFKKVASRDDYPGINWTPPQRVRSAFRRGLKLYEEGRGGDGLVQATVDWARRLAAGEQITPDKAVKMNAWHARHASDKRPGWDKEGQETPGYVAFLLWGGEAGRNWSAKLVSEMESYGEKGIKALEDEDDIDAIWVKAYWDEFFAQGIDPIMRESAAVGARDTYRQLGVTTAFNLESPDFNQFVLGRDQRFAEQVNETTWNSLRKEIAVAIDEGRSIREIERVVQQVMGDRIRSSAETIARTETIGALNGGALEGAKQSGVKTKKTWIASLDPRTRESHVDAHIEYQARSIDIDADFEVGGGSGQAPGQIGLPEEDINCRCTIGWDVDLDALEGRSIDRDAVNRLQRFVEGK